MSGATSVDACTSRRVSRTHSASCEIGTQTSVVQRLAAGTQRERRIERVVTRLPEPRAIFGRRRPLEAGRALLGGDAPATAARVLGHRLVARAVELEEQRRLQRVVQARVAVDRVDLHFVEQLDARDRDTELDRRHHRLHRALHRLEGTDGGGHGFGQAVQTQRDLGDDAERAFGSDEQARQVVAGRRLARAAAGVNRRCRRPGRPSGRARLRASCRSGRRSCPTRASPPCRRSSRRRRDRPRSGRRCWPAPCSTDDA